MLRLWPGLNGRHEYVLYFENRVPPDAFLQQSAYEHRVVPRPAAWSGSSIPREQILLPRQIRRDGLDLFFAPWYYGPVYCPSPKTVVGIWDISYTTHRHQYPLKEGLRLSMLSRHSSRYAAGIFTCSPFDKRQIEHYYKVPSDRICALPLAPDPRFTNVKDPARIEALRRKYGLPERYILSLGVIFSRRHVDVIIDAFNVVSSEYPDIGLLVVGRNNTVPPVDIEGRMRPLAAAGRGAYIPWVPEEELMDLYHGAWFYICVSTVDGEATMLKEAMRCGTPVITSPMLEEAVGGNAVIVPDPTSREDMARTFRQIIPDAELRERCAVKGLEWSTSLSWERVAEMSLEFLESR